MILVPRRVALYAKWGDRYEGDFDFIAQATRNRPIRWHEEVVAHYRGAA